MHATRLSHLILFHFTSLTISGAEHKQSKKRQSCPCAALAEYRAMKAYWENDGIDPLIL